MGASDYRRTGGPPAETAHKAEDVDNEICVYCEGLGRVLDMEEPIDSDGEMPCPACEGSGYITPKSGEIRPQNYLPSDKDVIPQPGVCPGCGEKNLTYGAVLSDSHQRLHPVECPDCGWTGWEVHEVSFSCFIEKVEE